MDINADAISHARANLAWLRDIEDPDNATVIVSVDRYGDLSMFLPKDYDLDDEGNRTRAVAWLARWTKRLATRGMVRKQITDYSVTVAVGTMGTRIACWVNAENVCTIVPKIGEDGAPVLEQKVTPTQIGKVELVPVMERVCPPSLLAAAAEVALAEVGE